MPLGHKVQRLGRKIDLPQDEIGGVDIFVHLNILLALMIVPIDNLRLYNHAFIFLFKSRIKMVQGEWSELILNKDFTDDICNFLECEELLWAYRLTCIHALNFHVSILIRET